MLQLEFTEQQPGVTVFGKMQYRAVNIDVKPGMTEIHFLPFKKAYYPSEYRLCNVDKTFPDVETIYIADAVACVDIPNQQKDFERDIGKHITEKCVPYNDWRNGHE